MKSIIEKPCLFDYNDYVEYLKDFFAYKKHVKPNYSYRQFSKDGNLTSPSYLKEVIDRKRKLTMRSVDKVMESLRLSPQEKKYFKILVNYNNSDEQEKKQWLNLLKKNNRISNSFVIGSDNDYTYLSHWIYGFIFCYVGQSDTEISIDRLEKMLIFPIEKLEIRDAVELLVNKGLIKKTGPSSYKRIRDFISTQDENKKLAIKMFHKTALKLADLAIDKISPANREFRSLTLRVPADFIPVLKEQIKDFYKSLPKTAMEYDSSSKNSNLIQVNIQMFPMTTEE